MTFRELDRLLKEDGWMVRNVRGSHYQYVHPLKRSKVTVPCHNGDIPKGTVSSILKQAELAKVLVH